MKKLWGKLTLAKNTVGGSLGNYFNLLISSSHKFELTSLGKRKSVRGLNETSKIFGPSGEQERLNCWLKNRLKKV